MPLLRLLVPANGNETTALSYTCRWRYATRTGDRADACLTCPVGFTRRLCRAEDNPGIVSLMSAVLNCAGIIVVRCLCVQPAILSRLWRCACRLADAWRIPPIPRAHDHSHIQDSAFVVTKRPPRLCSLNYRPVTGCFLYLLVTAFFSKDFWFL